MAVRFDADGEDYTRALALGTLGAITVSCWVKLSVDRNTWSTPWFIDNGVGDNWGIQTSNDGVTMGVVDGGNTLQNMGALTVGPWYYTCLVMSGATGTLYHATGAASALSTVAISGGTADVNAATLRIGESPWGGEWLNGCVAAFKFWTGALTAAEVANEWRQYVPARTASLALWAPLIVPETVDYSGNGRTLTGGTGATREDGPPIPWQVSAPRLILPADGASTAKSGTDSGTLTDAATGSASTAVSDAGTLTDTATLVVIRAATDGGSLDDTATLLRASSVTDGGSSTDAASLLAAFADVDAAALTDAQVVSAALTATDSAAVTDASALDAGSGIKADTDTAAVTDTAAITAATVAVSDSAALADASQLAASSPVTDTATLGESVTLLVIIDAADTHTATDAATLAAHLEVADGVQLDDTSTLGALAGAADAAALLELASILDLSIEISTPPERTWLIDAESRRLTLAAEPRVFEVGAEDRTVEVT